MTYRRDRDTDMDRQSMRDEGQGRRDDWEEQRRMRDRSRYQDDDRQIGDDYGRSYGRGRMDDDYGRFRSEGDYRRQTEDDYGRGRIDRGTSDSGYYRASRLPQLGGGDMPYDPNERYGGIGQMGGYDRGYGQQSGPHTGRGPKGYQRSDERIREEVCEVLTQHGHVDASEIEVKVQGGEVTLTGSVDSRQAKRLAEDAVEHCPGVRDVHNQLRVSQGGMQQRAVGGSEGRL